MLLLSHRVGNSQTINVGLIELLNISDDSDIITDICAKHFKDELKALRPDLKLNDTSIVVIHERGFAEESRTVWGWRSWELTYGQFTDRPASRIYTVWNLPTIHP